MISTRKLAQRVSYIFLSFILLLCIQGCSDEKDLYQGYVEGEARYLASPFSGDLMKRFVHRGDQVVKGQPLFQLDTNPQALDLLAKEAELQQAKKIVYSATTCLDS
jgi:HlyD family secretion protein